MALKSTALIAVAASLCFACNSNSEMLTESNHNKDVEHLSQTGFF